MNSQSNASRPPTPAEELYATFLAGAVSREPDGFDEFCALHGEHRAELERLHRGLLGAREDHQRIGLGSLGPDASAANPVAREIASSLRSLGPPSSRYRIQREIGRGGMGVVFEAQDTLLERNVALKVISDPARSEQLLPLFKREMRLTARLHHPGIGGIHDAGFDSAGRAYFAMPLLSGQDLSEVMRQTRAGLNGWTQARLLTVLVRVCETIAYAHSRGVIHRDLKPSNVRVGEYGEVFVLDWGLARELEGTSETNLESADSSVASTSAAGTPAYMSPEQACGVSAAVGRATDVYSIGAILREALVGLPPYVRPGEAPPGDELMRRLRAGPPDADWREDRRISAELISICDRATQRDPLLRYLSVDALAADLRAYLEGRVVQAHRTGPFVELRKWVGRNRGIAASLGSVVVAAGALVWVTGQKEVLAKENVIQKQLADKRLAEHQADAERTVRAETQVSAARLARQRGLWPLVTDSVERARAEGYRNLMELELLESEALLATGHTAQAQAKLTALELRNATSEQRGQAHLLLAGCAQSPLGEVSTVRTEIAQALAEKLSPADREFALGLAATDTREALEHFDAALKIFPPHYLASDACMSTLFFLGRYAEAERRAHIALAFTPEDTSALTLLAIVESVNGRAERSEEILEKLEHGASADVVGSLRGVIGLIRFFDDVPVTATSGPLDDSVFAAMVNVLPAMATTGNGRPPSPSILLPKVPVIADTYTALARMFVPCLPNGDIDFAGLLSGTAHSEMDSNPEKCGRELERSLERHDEGCLWYFLGIARLTTPPPADADRFFGRRSALPAFERAMSTPCLVPKIAHMARYLAGRCCNDLVAETGDQEVRGKAIAMIRRFEVDVRSSWDEVSLFGSLAMTCGIGSEGLRIVDDWIELHPDDISALGSRTNALRMIGAPGVALKEAEELLVKHPNDEKLLRSRDLSKQALEQLRSAPAPH